MSVASNSLQEALDGMLELRPFPASATRLMTACNSESTTVRDLSEIIRHDPGLSVRLLKIANSPLYGFSGEIRSIDHATVVLGMRALRDLAVSTAMADVFDSGDAGTAQLRQGLWKHSLAVGSVARLLAEKTDDVGPDEAFLGGVIHDVGKLFILDHDSIGYAQLIAECSLHTLPEREEATYGLAHTTVGQRCAQSWGLPDDIVEVIGCHHSPEDAEFGGALVDIVFAANHLASEWFDGAQAEQPAEEVLERAQLEVSPDDLEQIHQTALETVEEMAELCR